MAQNDGQAQAEQLAHEDLVVEVRLELAQLAALTQHQQAEPVQFSQRKTHRIHVVQHVGTVFVVVAVRNLGADFMQPRGPSQLAGIALLVHVGLGRGHLGLRKQRNRDFADPLAVYGVDVELGHQPLHRECPHILIAAVVADQVAQQAMAQAARGGLHFIDTQQVEQRTQNADAAADDGAPVFLHAA